MERRSWSSFRWTNACLVFVITSAVNGVAVEAEPFQPNYGDALSKTLLFLEAQRSGNLPSTQRITWRRNSGLSDGHMQGVDLVGGYYDAGDHVKFGLPMAFTVTMLSWSVIQYQAELDAAGQLEYAFEAIKWGTDYFIKAHPEPNVLWGEVGDGDSDHYCWQRPEDMTTSRQAYKIDDANPGSDLAGETAAAMAAASIAFTISNATYSSTLLQHAKQLFAFADQYRGLYDESINVAKKYYASSGYSDELLWAASWLFQATGEDIYLNYVVNNANSLGGTGWATTQFSWDTKYAGLQILAAKVLMEGKGGYHTSTLEQYQAKAEFFLCACLQKNNGYNVRRTPGGLLYVQTWDNMQYVSSASFLLAVYSDYLAGAKQQLNCPYGQVEPSELLILAKSQADYILGQNPMATSYLIGYGTNYPTQVHHRGASIVSYKTNPSFVGCLQGYEDWYNRGQENPNVLVGALVGGPDINDNFVDERQNYEQTEPCTYNNAPLVGLMAKLLGLGSPQRANKNMEASSGYHFSTPRASAPAAQSGRKNVGSAVELLHSISASWISGGRVYYRHRVKVVNVSKNPITQLILSVKNIVGPLWGLVESEDKNVYTLPQWIKVLKPGGYFYIVYIQAGPQATISVLGYK